MSVTMNEVFNGLTLFLVSLWMVTQPTTVGEPFETVLGIGALFGVVVAPSWLVAGIVLEFTAD